MSVTPIIEVAFGTVERSGVKFSLRVDQPVDEDDLRMIARLIEGVAGRVESILDQEEGR